MGLKHYNRMIDVRFSTFDLFDTVSRHLLRYSSALVCFALTILAYNCFEWAFRKSKLPKLPGPVPLPLIGNAYRTLEGPHKTLEYMQVIWPKKYGDIYSLKLGPFRSINISSPELVEVILKSSKLLDKGPSYRLFHSWVGKGLITSTGHQWRVTRKMLTPAFHFRILSDFFVVFVKQTNVLCGLIEKEVQGGGSLVSISKLIANCALDSLCEATMGVRMKAQTESSDYVNSLCRVTEIIIKRFSNPWLAFDWVFRLSRLHGEQSRLLEYMHRYADKVIEARWKMRQTGCLESPDKKHKPALLDTLIDHYPLVDDTGKVSEENKLAIHQEINTFLFAGHDTTGAAMFWFIYCMARNPDQQEKVWQELKDIYDDDRDCTEEDLTKLSFFDCCLKESMRLFTTVPHIERRLTEDVRLGDYLIPSGTDVFMLLYRLHHHERFYPDPFKFKPERFLEIGDSKHPYSYIPFSAGPRNCIGQRFAMMEMRVILTTLIRRFEFFWDENLEEPIPSFQAILKPLNQIKVGVKLRH